MAGWGGAVGERERSGGVTAMSDVGEEGIAADLSVKGPSGDGEERVKGPI